MSFVGPLTTIMLEVMATYVIFLVFSENLWCICHQNHNNNINNNNDDDDDDDNDVTMIIMIINKNDINDNVNSQ